MPEITKAFVKANIHIDPRTECWLWTRFYGRRVPSRVTRGPHRAVFNLHRKGWLEANIMLVQSCGDKRCVNPDHMEERHSPGSPGAERDSDAWEQNGDYTFKRAEANPKTRLSVPDVVTIKALLTVGFPQAMIAEYFSGVNRSTIHAIRHNKTWKHVEWPSKKRAVKAATVFCRAEKVGLHLKRLIEIAESR